MRHYKKSFFALSLLLFLIFGIAIYVQILVGNAGDKQWLLVAARMWLHGKRLYVDIIEVNPPLIIWIYSIPVRISMYVPYVTDRALLALLGIIFVGFSVWVSLAIIKEHTEFKGNQGMQLQWVLLICTIFLVYASPAFFCDREHIFLVLTFPYIVRYMPSLAQRHYPDSLRSVIGLMAAVGFCIKPYCFVVFITIQVAYFVVAHSFKILASTENIIICCVTALYALTIVEIYPAYLHVIVPMAFVTYSNIRPVNIEILSFVVALVMLAMPLADFRLKYASPYRSDIYYLLSICASCLAYAFLNNGWMYTFFPLDSMILITTGFIGWEFFYLYKEFKSLGKPAIQFLFGVRACVINLLLNIGGQLVMFYLIIAGTGMVYQRSEAYRQYKQDMLAFHSFGTISTDFGLWSQLSEDTGARWQTRFNNPWMLPKIFSDRKFADHHGWIIHYVSSGLAQDLDVNKPQVVFVDNTYVNKDTILIKYFNMFPDFHDAWSHYKYLHSINDCNFSSTVALVAVSHTAGRPLTLPCISRDVYQRIP